MLEQLIVKLEKFGDKALWQRLFTLKSGLIIFPALSGLLSSAGFAPLGMWPLTLAGLSLFTALIGFYPLKKQIFAATLAFGLAFNAATLWWLNFVLQGFGKLPLPLSWSVVLLFSLYLSLPYALLFCLAKKLAGPRRPLLLFCFLPVAWCLADFVIGWLFTGFPWVYPGYSALSGPLAAYAPLMGVRGINLCFYLCAAAIALAIYREFIFLPAAGLIFMGGIFATSIPYTVESKPLTASLVQGNIEQSVKWRADMVAPTLATYWRLTEPLIRPGQLVIWPESAIPLYLERAASLVSDLNTVFHQKNALLVTGMQRIDPAARQAYNSLFVLGSLPQIENLQQIPRYDKRQLVPFGEVVPFARQLRPLGSIFNFPMSSFSRGSEDQRPLTVFDSKFIPAICYESIFPELINALNRPDSGLVIMLSNDSWFGPTSGPLQHLNIARMRCLELQKPMLRATNSGITALIDADGRVLDALPADKEGVLTVTLTPRQGLTPYARLQNIPLIVILLVLGGCGLWHKRRPHNKQHQVLESLIRP